MTELKLALYSWKKARFRKPNQIMYKLLFELLEKLVKPLLSEEVFNYAKTGKNPPLSVKKYIGIDLRNISSLKRLKRQTIGGIVETIMDLLPMPSIYGDILKKDKNDGIEEFCQDFIDHYLSWRLPLKKHRTLSDDFEPAW